MMPHEFLDDDLRDRVTHFVLGSLDADEARAVRLHVLECDVCRREVEDLQSVADELVLASPQHAPHPRAWERVVERIRSRMHSRPARSPVCRALTADEVPATVARPHGPDPFHFVGAGEGEWIATSVPGVEVRGLHLDTAHDRLTCLARMAPGAAYPAHVHGGVEECYVIRGDLSVGDRTMRAGDYECAEKGSVHGVQSTREGCLLLIVSSLEDEILA